MKKLTDSCILMYNDKLLEFEEKDPATGKGRVSSVMQRIRESELSSCIKESNIAPMKRLRDIHDSDFLDELHKKCYSGLNKLDEETPITKEAFEVARFGAGGVLDAIDMIMNGETRRAFCMTSMPGHNAGKKSQSSGSLINPLAAGAHYLTKKYRLKRVLILDLDADHGKGTQEIFYDRKDVLTISLHEYPGRTGTGYYDETGVKGSFGYNLNIPFVSGYGDREYRVCLKEIVEKIAWQFMPQFILLGFGTNVLAKDDSSHLIMSQQGLYEACNIVKTLSDSICGSKLISVLEGGKNYDEMAEGCYKHLSLMVNKKNKTVDKMKKEELISYADWYGYSKILKKTFRRYWKL